MSSLQWKNIKAGLCPKCAFKLEVRGLLEPRYYCLNLNCDFQMSEEAYKRLIESMNKTNGGVEAD